MIRKVTLVSREIDGIAGAGGLKDVVRGLADTLYDRGYDVSVIIPRYGFLRKGRTVHNLKVPLGRRSFNVGVSEMNLSGISIHLLDAPCFSDKNDIYTYTAEDAPEPFQIGRGHTDVDEMNALFQAASVLDLMRDETAPDIVHGHDGHTGLIPLFMMKFGNPGGFFDRTGFLLTIHNAGRAYQQTLGSLSRAEELTGLPVSALSECILENQVNPLMAAGIFGNVNTVSPGYSRELLSGRDGFSGELGPEYKRRRIKLKGIYNGINPAQWQGGALFPEDGRPARRRHVCRELTGGKYPEVKVSGGIPDPELPWIVFHGRLTVQKGIDSLIGLPGDLDGYSGKFNFIIYGQGESDIEKSVQLKTESESGWIFLEGYNRELTSQLIAAASFVAVPSRWEPCGQIDMIGQSLGALPIVHSVGGLKKIRHLIDGFRYSEKKGAGLLGFLQRALEWEWKKQRRVSRMRKNAENIVYERRVWRKILVRGYLPLYRKSQKHIRHRVR